MSRAPGVSEPVMPDLLETKLEPVVARPGMVDRGRVVSALMARPEPPIVALVAPAGYGKTTVLAQWAARERRPVAWLTLDEADNDPAIFVAYLAAALARIRRLGDERIVPYSSRDRVLASSVPRLLTGLHQASEPGLLILDDVHRLVNRTCLDALTVILDHLPPRFRVAIAARAEPDIPLARFRAQRSLLEVGSDGLALDEDEAAALTVAAGHRLTDDEIRTLLARTEGWAAGLYLATLALGRGSGHAGTAAVSGADRYIAAYLRSEFEGTLDRDDLRFLARTAVLRGVVPPVAERVSDLPGAADRLQRLARGNLLIQEIGSGPTYRYHNLLREYLLAELERLEPGGARGLHAVASAWYEEAGDADLAFDHAIEGGDLDHAATIAAGSTMAMYQRGRLATLDRWLAAFPPEFAEQHAPLAVLATWVHLLSGRSGEAVRMIEALDRATWTDPMPDGSSFIGQRAILRVILARSGPRVMLEDATEAVAHTPAGIWRHQATFGLGVAHYLIGDSREAERWLETSVEDGRQMGALATGPMAILAAMRYRRRAWDEAESLIGSASERLRRGNYEEIAVALPVYAVAARVLIHRGDHRRARDMLVRAQLLRPLAGHGMPWVSVFTLLELARAYLAISDPGGAQLALREAEAIVRQRPALGILTDELIEVRRRMAGAVQSLAGSSTLTAAELRVLPLLQTYLSFAEIADRLQVSRNTVKTHAMSIYGKLWASSRGEAVERAVELGLLEPYPGLEPVHRASFEQGA
jgi:LuxR family maltose regulon positive regulatory protein